MGMKKQLLTTVAKLQDEGINLVEHPALFTWTYPEEPYIKFQMLIKETTTPNVNEDTVH